LQADWSLDDPERVHSNYTDTVQWQRGRGRCASQMNDSLAVELPSEPESQATVSRPTVRPKLRALTTLRFFAALHVVLFHMRVIGILSGGPWWYQNFASIGYIGVNFFFVLSGFILVYTYAGPPLNVGRFWRARFARIYPAYVVSLLASAPFFFFAVRTLNLPFFAWSKQHLVAACFLTIGLLQSWVPNAALTWNSVCWSLSVEAFFYAVFPLLMLWSADTKPRKLLLWIVGSCLVSLSVSLLYVILHPDGIAKINSGETTLLWKNVLSFNPLVRLPEFLVGVFAGRLFLARSDNRQLATPLIMSGLAVVATITLLVGKIPSPFISAGFLSPAFGAIIYGLALQPRWGSFLEARWLVLLGDASYSLYLLHSIVISKVFDRLPHLPWWLRVCAAVAATLAASLFSYLVVEEPARRILRPRGKPAAGSLRSEAAPARA
jgi:peptidoglycan/LPS O-acetylase OafA/YrhL